MSLVMSDMMRHYALTFKSLVPSLLRPESSLTFKLLLFVMYTVTSLPVNPALPS